MTHAAGAEGHEIPLVERIEQIDGVKHGSFVRARQLLDERFDVAASATSVRMVAGAMSREMMLARKARSTSAPRNQRHRHPAGGDEQARITQLMPIEAESSGMNEDQRIKTAAAIAFAKRSIVMSMNGFARKRKSAARQEQNFARRLVDRVSKSGIEDSRGCHCPELTRNQDQGRAGAKTNWQQKQRRSDTERAVYAAREQDSDDEPGNRQEDGDLCQQDSDRISVDTAGVGRHAQLLIDHCCSNSSKADDGGQAAQVLRLRQQPQRFAAANASFVHRLQLMSGVRQPNDLQHQCPHTNRMPALTRRRLLAPNSSIVIAVIDAPRRAAKAGAAADQAKEPPCLAS